MKITLGIPMAAALMASTAFAQSETATEATTDPAAPPPVSVQITPLEEAEVSAEQIAGADVYSVEGENIGDVSNIVFTSTGEIEAAVVSVGGFLGFGRHSVAVPADDLSVVERSDREGILIVQVPMTEDQLKEMPEFTGDVSAESAEPATE